ncbi:hypothetical protein ACIBCT_20790 [Streptosporangium sp. NPDC050855]|uniref:hypothetical protein n=1 Tax=Streptosporangium sp. NPDC050855 TaxID=3366194 RepID=UPI00379416E6
MSDSGRRIVCVCCGVEGPAWPRRLRRACYLRHRYNGRLDAFPLDKAKSLPAYRAGADRAREAYSRLAAERAEEYAFLRSCGESAENAAKRLGISSTTAWRYERAMTTQQSEMAS